MKCIEAEQSTKENKRLLIFSASSALVLENVVTFSYCLYLLNTYEELEALDRELELDTLVEDFRTPIEEAENEGDEEK